MRFGFAIDQNRCIGCHACTVACKAEHNVPIGVNRTWVKYIEKGEFPNTSRHFAVLRCNHCDQAPCIEICPTVALFRRADGIVDFDGDRCIGCKSCMQACPYDALYIDPDSNTAAKCNFCAHRVEAGLKPACEIVCPTQAIISGDLDDPTSAISRIAASQQASVRKPEKRTQPKLFYVGVDVDLLHPTRMVTQGSYLWSERVGEGESGGAGERESGRAGEGESGREGEGENERVGERESGRAGVGENEGLYSVQVTHSPIPPLPRSPAPPFPRSPAPPFSHSTPLIGHSTTQGMARIVYDVAHPRPWGRMIASYLWTKSIAAGVLLVAASLSGSGLEGKAQLRNLVSPLLALIFLSITVLLLIFDLKRPERFLYLLTKPNFKSWLVLGGYILLLYGIAASVWLFFGFTRGSVPAIILWAAAILAAGAAGYSAFLFAQAKARDLWQSPLFLWHLLAQAVTAGGAILIIFSAALRTDSDVIELLAKALSGSLTLTLAIVLSELFLAPVSEDVKRATDLLKKGSLSGRLWAGFIGAGVLLPIALLLWSIFGTAGFAAPLSVLASILALMGLWIFEDLWIQAGQAAPLS